EDDVGWDFVTLRALQAPLLEGDVRRVIGLLCAARAGRCGDLDAELEQEAARLARPGQRQAALRARHADIEQAACFVQRARLAQPVRTRIAEALVARGRWHLAGRRADAGPAQALEQLPRRVAGQQRRALKRDLRVAEQLFEIGRARIEPDQHHHLLVRDAL